VGEGEVVTLVGRNGAGKSTTVKSIMGLVLPTAGQVTFLGADITGQKPYIVARAGVGYVPEERRIFSRLTVLENLQLAAMGRPKWTPEIVFDRFPSLARRRTNRGDQLSGGEQQMLAIARVLMYGPRLLLLDEPSQGLAPAVVEQVMEMIVELCREGMSILLVEQNVEMAMALGNRHYVIDQGRIAFHGTAEELKADAEMWGQYFTVDVDDSGFH
jgi:branched-chain amino acid transport system ATP-binding protein